MMIKVEHLRKNFNDVRVLEDINIEVEKGEVVVIIGPSGSGKSTFLRCLNLLEIPDEGSIKINNAIYESKTSKKKDIYRLRAETAMVFQNYSLFKNKTALQNVMAPLLVTKKMKKSDAIPIAEGLLNQVGLSDKANQYPASLSGGQQQRVGIARALAVDPYAILFDEPTSALDPELVGEVLEVIRSLARRDTTMIIVTHEMSFAREVADRVLFMDGGKIIDQGTPEEIFENSQNERIKRFLDQIGGESRRLLPV